MAKTKLARGASIVGLLALAAVVGGLAALVVLPPAEPRRATFALSNVPMAPASGESRDGAGMAPDHRPPPSARDQVAVIDPAPPSAEAEPEPAPPPKQKSRSGAPEQPAPGAVPVSPVAAIPAPRPPKPTPPTPSPPKVVAPAAPAVPPAPAAPVAAQPSKPTETAKEDTSSKRIKWGGVGAAGGAPQPTFGANTSAAPRVDVADLAADVAQARSLLREDTPDSREQARQILERTAAVGDVAAMETLGSLILEGPLGPLELERARNWLLDAADAGSPVAMYQLGRLYRLGMGVEPDTAAAADWLRLSADRGFVPAQVDLAMMILSGNIAEGGREEAFRLLRTARTLGDPMAGRVLALWQAREGEG